MKREVDLEIGDFGHDGEENEEAEEDALPVPDIGEFGCTEDEQLPMDADPATAEDECAELDIAEE